ncbi:hypothetical protein ACQR1Y_12175 [Bradyrhizobium sp. HKCCYLRH3099]|uniref:hypothetical protein n=1 Tax=unclassified Bradyrhizobium TaxID=2631580 RepID=UPI003EC066AF
MGVFLLGKPQATDINVRRTLVVYNTASTDGLAVANYYVANRPGMATVDVLGVTADTTEVTTSANMQSQIRTPIRNWLAANPSPAKRYIVMCRGLPSRVHDAGNTSSVDYMLARSDPNMANAVGTEYAQLGSFYFTLRATPFDPASFPGTSFLVTRMDMGGSLAATKAYIDKIKAMYNAMPVPAVLVSAKAASLGGSNYWLDDCRDPAYSAAFNASYPYQQFYSLYGFTSPPKMNYQFGLTSDPQAPFSPCADVTAYMGWGTHASLPSNYAYNGTSLVFTGKSSWYIVTTVESFSGIISSGQGNFETWFKDTAVGGAAYSRTPIGMGCTTDEPTTGGIMRSNAYANWEEGLPLADCLWSGRATPYFMAVGDPLVVQ